MNKTFDEKIEELGDFLENNNLTISVSNGSVCISDFNQLVCVKRQVANKEIMQQEIEFTRRKHKDLNDE